MGEGQSSPPIVPGIPTRSEFARLCNERGYIDAVEVGTDQGLFAAEFLSRFGGNWLFCVDSYQSDTGFPYDRRGDMLSALLALQPYRGRYRLIIADSRSVAPWVGRVMRYGPEFVYIDGAHDRGNVEADIEAWWPTIPPGGILAGHDFADVHPGVIEAVEAFGKHEDLTIHVTTDDWPQSWYVTKPGEHPRHSEGKSDDPGSWHGRQRWVR